MYRPRCVDVKADGLAEIVQPEQRCRGCICSVYRLENAPAFEETVGNAISIRIETDYLIAAAVVAPTPFGSSMLVEKVFAVISSQSGCS